MVAGLPVWAIAAPLMAWAVYRRVRITVQQQKVIPWRLLSRSLFLGSLLIFLSLLPHFELERAGGALAGLTCGFALSLLSLRHTRYETKPDGVYYKLNPVLGLAVSALFIARIIYRGIVLYPAMQGGSPEALTVDSRSLVTLILFGLLAGYYIGYYLGVLRHSRQLQTAV